MDDSLWNTIKLLTKTSGLLKGRLVNLERNLGFKHCGKSNHYSWILPDLDMRYTTPRSATTAPLSELPESIYTIMIDHHSVPIYEYHIRCC